MGYAIMMGHCVVCKGAMTFNPHKVPSTALLTGKREPICRGCIEVINRQRAEKGLALWPIATDAYEAIPEGAL
jgi:hypothetical protein